MHDSSPILRRLPKTYPTLACPTFAIQKPIKGLTNEQVTRLSNEITREAQRCRGSEMIFQVCVRLCPRGHHDGYAFHRLLLLRKSG